MAYLDKLVIVCGLVNGQDSQWAKKPINSWLVLILNGFLDFTVS
jgi:hypothetical protein